MPCCAGVFDQPGLQLKVGCAKVAGMNLSEGSFALAWCHKQTTKEFSGLI